MTQRSAAALEAQESFEVHKEKNIDLLHSKAVGILGVLFLTVTGAAPMSAMLGNVPFAAGFGNGIYVPAAFLLATIVLTIFSVGYAAMAQKVSSVGGFYSYISLGLGRDMGMAAGMASFVSYSVFEASLMRSLRLLWQRMGPDPFWHQCFLDLVCSVHDRADLDPELLGRASSRPRSSVLRLFSR